MLLDLARGRVTREVAAEWAWQWVAAEDPKVEDDVTWAALNYLAGADSPSIESDEYLYGPLDFAAWLEEFHRRTGGLIH